MIYFASILCVALLALISLLTGVSDVSLVDLFSMDTETQTTQILLISRIPRTIALIFAGSSMAIAGLIMQMIVRNRFAEPSTTGTMEAASLGLLVVTILVPTWPIFAKMLVASGFALTGTGLFLSILSRVPLRSALLVPLIGLMLAGVINALTVFIAYRYDLLQTIIAWMIGDFSGVLRGRYELLWFSFVLTIGAYFAADKFTLMGLGEAFATNLGIHYRRIMVLGLSIVAVITATVVVSVGAIPFLGLIVPNVVSLLMGDNLRRSLPWVGILGAGFVLACDIVGRLVRFPYEIPLSTIAGILGSALFLFLILRKRKTYE